MPYYISFEEMPPERPVGPLHGEYVPAHAAVKLSLPSEEAGQDSGTFGWLRRLIARKAFVNLPTSNQKAIVRIAQILRDAGFQTIECDYDGGNDEGFAHFGSATTATATFSAKEAVERLRGTPLGDPKFDPWENLAGLDPSRSEDLLAHRTQRTEAERIDGWLESFVDSIAVVLLGEGYGTGEYAMAGRFRLDLQTGELTDLSLDPPPDFRDSNAFSLDDYYPDEEQG